MTTINKHNIATVTLATVTGAVVGGYKVAMGEEVTANAIQGGIAGVMAGLAQHFLINKNVSSNLGKYAAALAVGAGCGGVAHGVNSLVSKCGTSQAEAETIASEAGLE